MSETPRRFGLPALAAGIGGAGCLGGIALCALILAIVGGALVLTTNSFKSNDVTQQALARARSNAAVVDALGTPIEIGWLITGSLSTQGISGDADLVIPISGPKKGGILYASARRSNGVWQYYTLAVRVDGENGIIDLR
jgi:hypothetical protein